MNQLSVLLLTAPTLLRHRAEDVIDRRQNDVVWALIVIPIAVVIALGLITAWFIYCQRRGMWPAMDMPSWSSGGTWKLYCKR
ncbi:hypothetical protein RF644_05800 [Kocuria sp. CPCC 205258]|uniref:hypothetical protein n=1 Tax=Kocuria sp. CPCC 205258 TaxID=3073552 RepID=UPI0034D5DF8C